MASQPRSGETDIADFTARSGERLDQRDVLELQRVLEERVGRDESDAAGRSKRLTITRKQVVKIAAGIAIIAATAYAMKGDEERALAAGCDGYITKPIDTRQLPIDIERFLAW